MQQRIIDYVDGVFKNIPESQTLTTIKKGFVTAITKKYEENLFKGMPSEEAFDIAIANTPEILAFARDMSRSFASNANSRSDLDRDFDDLIDEYENMEDNEEAFRNLWKHTSDIEDENDVFTEFVYNPYPEEGSRQNDIPFFTRNQKIKNFSMIFWPLVVVAYFLYSTFMNNAWRYSWVIFIIAAAIQCFVNFFLCHSSETRGDLIAGTIWLFLVAIYLLASFWTGLWRYTWVIMILAAAIQCLVNLYMTKTLSQKQGAASGFVWFMTAFIYFTINFFFKNLWHITWVIFIAAIAFTALARILVRKKYDEKNQ